MNTEEAQHCIKCNSPLAADDFQVASYPLEVNASRNNDEARKTVVGRRLAGSEVATDEIPFLPRHKDTIADPGDVTIESEGGPSFFLTDTKQNVKKHFTGEAVVVNRENLDETNTSLSGETHARFLYKDGKWYIQDTSSNHLTFLQVKGEVELQHGDMMVLGNKIFRFSHE